MASLLGIIADDPCGHEHRLMRCQFFHIDITTGLGKQSVAESSEIVGDSTAEQDMIECNKYVPLPPLLEALASIVPVHLAVSSHDLFVNSNRNEKASSDVVLYQTPDNGHTNISCVNMMQRLKILSRASDLETADLGRGLIVFAYGVWSNLEHDGK